ncbi:hypothetical protein CLAFUW4_13697 [Fulvia fulva]|uniref:Uncharacterized protein n=1 Tax=Passalora fulva TaxID=5499 RepID=A0A9Q8PL70_PASFU|nr:uncharacterized protein CLAFUR5_13546 [Fulvia fulva]KAK4610095.1 hypothetical protein CLAFUR4_13700 [Fulvia fulva]KAK4611465.1 hypothetical protein CLAFUR0_13704 [Fulvia fulva]UJO24466.1 hypothetical protein CLAFUR5_13546 [Fulvia fulva]WPV22022.1 hypothetical protein CLAFUW4_13697 [Fulvia fulva]WPV37231.1 hypothetical protein CLAFUW7_13705 [Fulvia fulva]
MSYTQYHIPDDSFDTWFQELLTATPIPPTDLDIATIRRVCSHMTDRDVLRIVLLARYHPKYQTDFHGWRVRVSTCSNREAKYLVNCLRFEYYREKTMEALNLQETAREEGERRRAERVADQQQEQQQEQQQADEDA